MNSIVITSFIAFAIIAIIPTVLENVFAQGEEAEQRQNQSSSSSIPTLDENNNGMIISEGICPPYCSPPPPIQELPQEQSP